MKVSKKNFFLGTGSKRSVAMLTLTSVGICRNSHLEVNGVVGLRAWGMVGLMVVYMAVTLGLQDIMTK